MMKKAIPLILLAAGLLTLQLGCRTSASYRNHEGYDVQSEPDVQLEQSEVALTLPSTKAHCYVTDEDRELSHAPATVANPLR